MGHRSRSCAYAVQYKLNRPVGCWDKKKKNDVNSFDLFFLCLAVKWHYWVAPEAPCMGRGGGGAGSAQEEEYTMKGAFPHFLQPAHSQKKSSKR